MSSVPEFDDRRSSRFRNIVNAFLSQNGLPFAHVLSAERIERVFAKHDNLFATSAIPRP